MPRNITWTRDELIIALDFYMQHRAGGIPSKTSPEIHFLSEELNRLAVLHNLPRGESFRSVNAVYLKMMNFHHIDPDWHGEGMKSVGQNDVAVWQDFAHRPEELNRAAKLILNHIYHFEKSDNPKILFAAEEEVEAIIPPTQEGRILSHSHLRRERNPRLVERLKDEYYDKHEYLDCSVCEFDYEKRYGSRGHRFMEAHHIKPISQLPPEGEEVSVKDLALICASCHRMVHRKSPWLTLDELKGRLRA